MFKFMFLSLMFFGLEVIEASDYKKKSAYETPYGTQSTNTGRPRVKSVSGHYKHTTKGYEYVSPYYRSI